MFEHLNVSTDVVNQLSLLAAALIIIITVFVVAKYIKQIKNDTSSGELAEENWDGIGEYKNSLPIGWALSMVGTMIWSVWYWLFSPYAVNAYSQIGEYNEEVKTYNATFEKKWANPSAETLHDMGEGVFLVNCAPCHGITAEGIDGKAQDLTAEMYKSFGVEGLSASIGFGKKGEIGTMPAFKGILTDIQTKAVATYIMSLGK
jgi:cytochrome c oxidase cbb3-type subunit 3